MIRIVVLYPQSGDNWFNKDYYIKNHIPLAKKCLEPMHGENRVRPWYSRYGRSGSYFAIAYLTLKPLSSSRLVWPPTVKHLWMICRITPKM